MGGGLGKTFGRLAIGAAGYGLGTMAGYPALGSMLSLGIGSWMFPPKQENKVRQVRAAFGTSSVEGTPLPVVFGRVRIGATLMWSASEYVYHEVVKKSGGKGGGGGSVIEDAWYTLSFVMAIGEGPIQLIKIYEGKNVVNPSYTWYDGDKGQVADSFLTSKTGKSIAYKNTAYVVFQDYRVGPSASLPQLTFEVISGQSKFDVSLTITDTDGFVRNLTKQVYVNVNQINNCITPAYAIKTMITSDRFGGGFKKNIDWLTAHTDCIDKNYYLNLALTERRDLASIIQIVASHGWLITVFSGSNIKIRLANGDDPTQTLELDDMLGRVGEQVIDVSESGRSDRFNRLSVEYTDPKKEYSARPVQVEDLADQQDRGIKKNTVSLLGFTDPDIVKDVGYKMMRNSLFGRRLLSFSLGPRHLDVEPGDLFYINAGTVGLSLMRSRIIGVDETEEFNLTVNAREEPNYIYDPVNYSVPTSDSSPAVDTSAGLSNAIGFKVVEVPKELMITTGNVSLLPAYAIQNSATIGYNIYTSVDDSTYNLSFSSRKPLNYGVIGNTINKDSWLDTDEFKVNTDSTYSNSFSTASRSSMMNGENLLLINDELMLFQTSTVGNINNYTIDNLVRNRYNTVAEVHPSGSSLFQINDGETFDLLKSRIGTKYYFKAVPVNSYNQEGDISQVSSVGMTIEGWAYRPYRPGSVWMEENGINQRGKSKTGSKDVSIGWSIVDKETGFGVLGYGTGDYGMYAQDSNYTGAEVEVYTSILGSTTELLDTLIIQPSAIDTWIDDDNPITNFGTNNNIDIRSDTPVRRVIMKFDFSSIPTGATIVGATLSLYNHTDAAGSPTGRTYWANRVTEIGWVETEATWNEYSSGNSWSAGGGDFTTTDRSSAIVPTAGNWMDWDVQAQVQYAVDNTEEIAHFLIKDSVESSIHHVSFYSREGSSGDITLRPKLSVKYMLVIPTVPTISRTALVGLTQSYTYTEAFNLADNTTFQDEITFRVYTKSIYGRSKDYNEKVINSI